MADLVYSFGHGHPGAARAAQLPAVPASAAARRPRRREGRDARPRGDRHPARSGAWRAAVQRLPPRPAARPDDARFEELSDDPTIVAALRQAYDDNPELVDLMVGLYAEKKPDGFAFSDTAFRVFILMASRRLKSDRFFTRLLRPDDYTEEGVAWVTNETLSSVLRRHVPELRPVLAGVSNPFAPWDSPRNRHGATRWGLKQKAWNRRPHEVPAAEPLHVARADRGRAIGERPFKEAYPSIPIDGLVVADRFPADEDDRSVGALIRAEELAASLVPPAAAEEWPIDADPRVALEGRLRPAYQRRYRARRARRRTTRFPTSAPSPSTARTPTSSSTSAVRRTAGT